MNVNENDLQKAIDDIAKSSGGGVAPAISPAHVVPAGVENEDATTSYIATDGQMPADDVAIPVADESQVDGATTTVESANEPEALADAAVQDAVAAAVQGATTVDAGVPAVAPEVVEKGGDEATESEGNEAGDGAIDSGSVHERAIEDLKPIIGTVDLRPILDKVELLPETKFKILKSIIETTNDKETLPMAYTTAKEIADDEARAGALLYLVEMAEKLD